MEVPTCGDWFRKDDTTGINSLENTKNVASPRNLFDQDWSESFRSELFVNAEKVDFGTLNYVFWVTKTHSDT